MFVLPSLITNNPPSKTSAGWTWQIWTTLVLARTSKQASRVNRTYPTLEPSNPQWFNPWNLSRTKGSLIWGHFFRSKKSVSTRSVFTLAPPLGFPNLSRKPTTKKAPVTKQGDQPFSKRESFSHWTVVCSQLSWQTDARWIQFELLAGCETVRALAVRSEIWKVETCFFSKMTLKESTNDSGVKLLGVVKLDDAACGQIFVDMKLCTACESMWLLAQFLPNHVATGKLDSKNPTYRLALDGTIMKHKEIGLGRLLPSKLASRWYFYSSIPSWQAWTLLKLHQGLLQVTLW